MARFVFALSLLSLFLYPSLMSIIGTNERYVKGQDNPMMIIFVGFVGFLSICYTLKDFSKYIHRVHPFFYWLPFLLTVVFVIESFFMSGMVYDLAFKAFLIFFVYSVPAIYIGANIAYKDELMKTFKYIHFITIIISVGIIISIPESLTTGRIVLGETNYQAIAYMSAFCVGVLLYRVLFKPDFVFSLFKKKYYRVIEIVLLIIIAFNVFFSGGRGGALLLIINVVILFVLYFKHRGILVKGLTLVGIGFLILIPIIASIIASNDELSALFEYGFKRAFAYVSDSGGIDMRETSNRDILYKWAIDSIQDNAFGYGFFRSYGLFYYPHNFFLEILLDGGVVYFSFMIILTIYCFNKLIKILKTNINYYCFLPLVTYPVVILFFSLTYKHSSMFWFCLSYIMSFVIKNKSCSNLNSDKLYN